MDRRVEEYRFEDDGRIPNNPGLPLLYYPRALGEEYRDPGRCRELLRENGWGGAWVNGVFSYHHYHSVSHEVLCVVSGTARLELGGPSGKTFDVEAGDVIVIPAGVGHRNAGSDGSFRVVGAYPPGQERYDIRTGEPGERPGVLENIRRVALPDSDPVFGPEGPLVERWGIRR